MEGSARRTGVRRALIGALLTLVVYGVAHWPGLVHPFVINDDARQQIYWMQKWREPALYPPSPLHEYARAYVPWGVQATYRAGALFMNPLRFSHVVSGALYVAMALFMASLTVQLSRAPRERPKTAPDERPDAKPDGKRKDSGRVGAAGPASDDVAYMAGLCVYWITPFFYYQMSGGLARSFAGPLLALFVLAWTRRSAAVMAVSLLLQALLIPYIFVLCGGALGLGWLAGVAGVAPRPAFPSRWPHYPALIAMLAVVWLWQSALLDAGFGPLVGRADMLGAPEYGPDGRLHVFPEPGVLRDFVLDPLEYLSFFRPGWASWPEWLLWTRHGASVAAMLGLAAAIVVGARRVDWKAPRHALIPMLWLGVASITLYKAARMFLLKLFVPDRYVSYSINLALCLALALCAAAAWRRVASRRPGAFSRRALPGAVVAVVMAVSMLRLYGAALYDYREYAPLCRAVRELDKDALLAGPPRIMDNVLTFGGRNVLASYELTHPWSLGYWEIIEPRLDDFLQAYYTDDVDQARRLADAYKVTHVVVDERSLVSSEAARAAFFEPYASRAAAGAAAFGAMVIGDGDGAGDATGDVEDNGTGDPLDDPVAEGNGLKTPALTRRDVFPVIWRDGPLTLVEFPGSEAATPASFRQ